MTDLNLRTYIQEIDDLIEEGQQLEEAIAHCRHILKAYPKHIDTYRLLGKAYLESKRFGDAGDIFQRVLSAIPHDFVSHVGMAIIREDEGNLDAAIWHMERSAESQPGNAAIEEEIKRLIGKRDGIEPQRVRPTRGALARMYYHGELYSYATSELQKALEEDPDRPDLQLLLADTYWRTDKRLEAADLCRQILEKLPHCFLANQITAALLQASGKAQEAAINLRRLIALDPYMAFIDNPMDIPGSVDSSAVQLEKLSWMPGQPLPSAEATQPDWAASLGVDLRDERQKEADQEAMPSWLQSPAAPDGIEAPEEASVIHPFAGAKPPPGAEIPEWMREAGWVESTGEATEGPLEMIQGPEDEAALPSPDQPLESADLPSWLSEITSDRTVEVSQPTETPISEELTPETGFPAEVDDLQELPEWIQNISPQSPEGEPETVDYPIEEEPDLVTPSPPHDELMPDLSEEAAVEGLPEFLSEEEPMEGEIPEYPPWLEPSTPGATDTIVSWLGDKTLEETAAADDIPTWMRGTGPLDEAALQDYKADESLEEIFAESPPSFEEITSVSAEADTEDEAPPSDIPVSEPAPEWLEDISELEEELPASVSVQPEETPDWLADSTLEPEEDLVLEEAETPEWLSELDEEEVSEEVIEEVEEAFVGPEEFLEDVEEPPEWLSEVIQDEILEEAEQAVKPEWLEGIEEAEILPQEELLDIDDAPDWLTEMSMIEEVDTSPDLEEEEPPEWLKGLAEVDASPAAEQIPEPESEPDWVTEETFPEIEEEIISAEDTPEWLQELAGEPEKVEEPAEEIPAEEIPAEEIIAEEITAEEIPAEEIPAEEILPEPSLVEETPPAGEQPDWLQELRDAAPDEDIYDEIEEEVAESITDEEPIALAEVPDWLQEFDETKPEEEAIGEVLEEMPEPSAAEDALLQAEVAERLEVVSETTMADEVVAEAIQEEISEPAPMEEITPTEEAPDWLREIEGVAEETPLVSEEIPEEAFEPAPIEEPITAEKAPDWLQDFEGVTEEAPKEAIEPEPVAAEETPEEVIEPEAVKAEEVPDWLQEMEEVTEEAPEEVIAPESVTAEEVPDWLQEMEEVPEEAPEEVIAPEPVTAEEVPDWLQEVEEITEEAPEEVITPELITAEEVPDWLQEVEEEEAPEEVITPEPVTAEEVPDWLQEVEEVTEEAPEEVIAPEPVTPEAVPDWLQEVEEVTEEAPEEVIAPEPVTAEEAPDWLREFTEEPSDIGVEEPEKVETAVPDLIEAEPSIPAEMLEEGIPAEIPSIEEEISIEEEALDKLQEKAKEEIPLVVEEAPDRIQEIEEGVEEAIIAPPEEKGEIEELTPEIEVIVPEMEVDSEWQPEFSETEIEEPMAPEPVEVLDFEPLQADLEESFDWLQESAQEVTPEPEIEVQPAEPIYTSEEVEDFTASIEDALDDDEVFSFLDNLAAREAEAEGEVPPTEPGPIEPALIQEEPEEKLIEEHEIPEELDESLMWLEQLAGEEPVEDFTPPVFVEEPEEEVEVEVPEWLEEVAEKPEVAPTDEMLKEKEEVAEELAAEPTPSISELSTMETIISKRPVEEEPTAESLKEGLPEERLEEAEPLTPPVAEGEELVWDVIGEDELIEPQRTPEAELTSAEVPEAEPVSPMEDITAKPAEVVEEGRPPIKDKQPDIQFTDPLSKARSELQSGAIEEALSSYSNLIEENQELEAVIQDLKDAIAKTPREPTLWQTLGDALMKSGRLSDAIDAYRRGMEAV